MADVTITYKGANIATMDATGSKTLQTAGTYCEGDIGVEYVKPGGGGDTDIEDGIITRTISGSYYNSRVTEVGSYAFASCTSLAAINFPACTSIATSAFINCTKLSVASFSVCGGIGSRAFSGCSSLTTVSFPVCSEIGSYAFLDCVNLTSADFPSCKNISASAFQKCEKLTTISFPICFAVNSSAFVSCLRLLSAYFLGSSVPLMNGANIFQSTPIGGYTSSTSGVYGSIFVRASLLTAFQSAARWSVYSARMVGLTDKEIAALDAQEGA